jgi:SAM-dependent methyltransferase
MKNIKSMDLFGNALRSYFEGNIQSKIIIRNFDGELNIVPMSVFFRNGDELNIDKEALCLCKGTILDVGAGTGDHALLLQNNGFDVTAIDISNDSCEIMRKRGIRNVVCCDFFNYYSENKYDTILLLGRSIGAVEDINGFLNFLKISKKNLTNGGHIIFNSINEPSKDKWRTRKMSFEYNGENGDIVNWFDIGENLLNQLAIENGYYSEIISSEKDGNYLALLGLGIQ